MEATINSQPGLRYYIDINPKDIANRVLTMLCVGLNHNQYIHLSVFV
jgi:hypothetical protein